MFRFWSKEDKITKRAKEAFSRTRFLFKKNRAKISPDVAEVIKRKLSQMEIALGDGSSSELISKTQELESIKNDHLSKFSKSKLRQNVEALIVAVVLALLIRTFIVQPFKIPSGSMIPTLLVGDHLLVGKFVYGTKVPFTDEVVVPVKDIKRGDVAVFTYPNGEGDPSKVGVHYIKRVVGLPGDKIDLAGRNLVINGEEIPLSFEGDFLDDRFGSQYDQYEEDMFGAKHTVIYRKDREYTQKGKLPVEVPPGHVFVMGDNRDNSQDSRFWGFVPVSNLEGKAFIIHWSWDFDNQNILNKVRWNRILSLID